MAEADETSVEQPRKRSKKPLLAGLLLAVLGGGAGFYGVYSGMILGHDAPAGDAAKAEVGSLPDVAFVPIESVILALGAPAKNRHLKFTAQIEVASAYQADVALMTPRILDVFNSYLSAIDPQTLEESAAIMRVRAQLLRRVQVVVGEGRVRDLLITEFVLN
jgi:flagellar protein FliL